MLKSFITDIKDQPIFFKGYLLFLLVMSYLVSVYSKEDFTLMVNANWTSFQDSFFRVITHFGDGVVALLIIAVLAAFKWRYSIIAILCFGISAGITQFLKRVVFEAERPLMHFWTEFHNGEMHSAIPVDDLMVKLSFPSGHATSAFSIFFVLALLFRNKVFGLVFIILAILISYSRVYLGQHYLEDIFAGAIIGGFISWLIYSFLNNRKWGSWSEKSLLKW